MEIDILQKRSRGGGVGRCYWQEHDADYDEPSRLIVIYEGIYVQYEWEAKFICEELTDLAYDLARILRKSLKEMNE